MLKIRQIRETKGLNQNDVARDSEISQPYLSELESGEKDNPSKAVLIRLAKALGVPVAELLEDA